MEFMYDGSHFKEDESMIAKYSNNISVWAIFNESNNESRFEARIGEDVIRSFEKYSLCEMFVVGMAAYAKLQGEVFKESETRNLPLEIQELQEELIKTRREKEKIKQLSENLIKGIMKNGNKPTEEFTGAKVVV